MYLYVFVWGKPAPIYRAGCVRYNKPVKKELTTKRQRTKIRTLKTVGFLSLPDRLTQQRWYWIPLSFYRKKQGLIRIRYICLIKDFGERSIKKLAYKKKLTAKQAGDKDPRPSASREIKARARTQSHAIRRVRQSALAGWPGLGVSPTSDWHIRKGYRQSLLAHVIRNFW